ncbi:uncharacterized protein LOC112464402 [Temnothorax curvispinosus]|uniref:Uncharacterized protein LOC112464402 n=1 Tax=Temnothorax curvispinosus TaxID=300111 RepID=A0A6J1QZ24_9HYME|nr:uncharacterized protein LOC112464402 [Temnothorax curvispinosus]
MWHIIKKGMGLNIPVYLKNIMRLKGYDTPIAIEKMSADTTKELELFGRTEMLKFIKEGEKYSDYFNKYHICPSEFRIPTGHKALLDEIQKFVANKLSTDRMYFMPELRLKKSNCQPRKLTENFNQKQKVYASRVASKLSNEDLDEGSLPSSSQHANSRSNPDTSTDINLNAEHDSLYALIMVWLKKQSKVSKEVEKQVVEKFSSASIEITIIEEGIKDDSESSDYVAKVGANIICPICQKKTKAHKLEYGKQGKMRWVKSNLRGTSNLIFPMRVILVIHRYTSVTILLRRQSKCLLRTFYCNSLHKITRKISLKTMNR